MTEPYDRSGRATWLRGMSSELAEPGLYSIAMMRGTTWRIPVTAWFLADVAHAEIVNSKVADSWTVWNTRDDGELALMRLGVDARGNLCPGELGRAHAAGFRFIGHVYEPGNVRRAFTYEVWARGDFGEGTS